MRRKITTLTMANLLFLILLFASGTLSGIISRIVYLLAFILPLLFGLISSGERGVGRDLLTLPKGSASALIPLIAPTVSVIILISLLTSYLIVALTGRTNEIDLGDSFILALISHALLPAILEEALFRYLPMRLIAPHSKRCAVIVSAIFFSLVHHDLFSIPYALFAGGIFMLIDLSTGSVIPSVILHFINNAISVGLIVYSDNVAFKPTLYLLLAILTVVSVVYIIKRRRDYLGRLSFALEKGEGVEITLGMMGFAALTLTLAIANLL